MSFIAAAAIIGGATLGVGAIGAYSAHQSSKNGAGGINVDIPEFVEDPYILKGQQALYPKGQEWLEGDFGFDMPEYGVSPYYTESQKALSGLGGGLLKGDVPEAYRSLITPGGDEYKNFMGGVRRDVTTGVQEDLAKRGIGRGGIGSRAISKAMGEVSGKYGYEDYLRTQENKAKLLGFGADVSAGVSSRGLTEAQMANAFGMDTAKLNLTGRGMGADVLSGVRGSGLELSSLRSGQGLGAAELDANIQGKNIANQLALEEQENQMWSDLMQAGVGMAGTVASLGMSGGSTPSVTPGIGSGRGSSMLSGSYGGYDLGTAVL